MEMEIPFKTKEKQKNLITCGSFDVDANTSRAVMKNNQPTLEVIDGVMVGNNETILGV